jgi:opacity protein-like surface antigen
MHLEPVLLKQAAEALMRAALLAVALIVLPQAASAQVTDPDFLFDKPSGSVGFRGGWMFARADSELFTFVQNQLTLDRKDFNAPAIGIDVDVAITPRVSGVFGFDFTRSSTDSEYRDLVDDLRLPITQTTSLREMNLSGGVKFALTPRGREVGTHAWIPAAVTPYVGAGAGMLQYKFQQDGDFVDFVDNSIFTDTFISQGWAPSGHVFGGVDVKAWKRVYLGLEARYLWANAKLERDFTGFDPIDLTGFKLTGGISVTF